MLSAEIIKKIKKVHIRSSRLVNTMMAGQYKSVFRGSGMEFEEVREYAAGDDVKSIDWKVSARLGRPFIKLYREERELIVMLLVDMSASQSFGTTDQVKKETAAEVAAVLAFNAIRNNDKVGAILFTDQVERYIPPKKGSAHIWRVIKEIYTFAPSHRRTDIQNAVRYLGKVCRKKSVAFLISDFMARDYMKPMKIAGKKHEIIGVHLSDPGEFSLPGAGILALEDFETGELVWVDASNAKTRAAYARMRQAQQRQTLEQMKTADIDCINILGDDSVAEALMKYFRYRERKHK